MPLSAAPSTTRRLLSLLSLLQSRRDWPAHVLAERLGVSERTVRRDIDMLRELDYAVEATRGPDGGYRLGAGTRLPPLMFDDEAAVALAISLRTASASGTGIEDAADRALRTVTRLLPADLALRIENLVVSASLGSPTESVVDPSTLLGIGEAIRSNREVRFDYASPGTPEHVALPAVRRVQPHHLLLHSGRWYLVGFSEEVDEWRSYRVDRMSLRSHTGRSFIPREVPGGDPGRFLRARFRGSAAADSWRCSGEAVLDAPLEAVAPFVGDGTATSVGSDRTRVRLGSWSWGSLAASLSRFEADLSEVHPVQLRDAFAVLSRRATLG